jgi:hypothetical protein
MKANLIITSHINNVNRSCMGMIFLLRYDKTISLCCFGVNFHLNTPTFIVEICDNNWFKLVKLTTGKLF